MVIRFSVEYAPDKKTQHPVVPVGGRVLGLFI